MTNPMMETADHYAAKATQAAETAETVLGYPAGDTWAALAGVYATLALAAATRDGMSR